MLANNHASLPTLALDLDARVPRPVILFRVMWGIDVIYFVTLLGNGLRTNLKRSIAELSVYVVEGGPPCYAYAYLRRPSILGVVKSLTYPNKTRLSWDMID